MPSRKFGACGRREIGRMSRISRTLRIEMPNVSPASPSVRYCEVAAIAQSRVRWFLWSALKLGVAIVFAVMHVEGEAAAIGDLHRARRLAGGHRLLRAAIRGLHLPRLAAQLGDGAVDRRRRGA